jgi:hypothetical protein
MIVLCSVAVRDTNDDEEGDASKFDDDWPPKPIELEKPCRSNCGCVPPPTMLPKGRGVSLF